MPVLPDIIFDFDSESSDVMIQLNAFLNTKVDCDAISFCAGYARFAYTLEYKVDGVTTNVGFDIANDALAFNVDTLELWVSAQNPILVNNLAFNGDVKLTLCILSGSLCEDFTMVYTSCVTPPIVAQNVYHANTDGLSSFTYTNFILSGMSVAKCDLYGLYTWIVKGPATADNWVTMPDASVSWLSNSGQDLDVNIGDPSIFFDDGIYTIRKVDGHAYE